MKSKTLRKRTRRRRGRRDVKKTKTKRGGMFRGAMSVARSKMGTTLYHDIIPLLRQYRGYLLTQEPPKAGDHVIVPHGEKHHTLFEGIEIDKGTKESIKNSKEDLENPVKGFGNLKTLYDKVTEGIEKKKKSKRGQNVQEQNRSFQSPRIPLSSSFVLQGTSLGAGPSPTQAQGSPFAHTPHSLTNPHFQSPSRNDNYIGDSTSPPKLNPYEKAPQSINPDDDELYVQGTRLFPNDENSTPMTSPVKQSPPRVSSKPRGPFSHFSHFSPSRRLVLP